MDFATLKNIVETSFANATEENSKLSEEILQLDGMSGKKTRHFYNNLLSFDGVRYLEIGTWKGSSVCSAMYKNKAFVTCIDNWSQYQYGEPRSTFLTNFEKYKGENTANFIEEDCFKIDVGKLPKFNVYLYDGDHSHEAQCKALTHYYDCLDPVFIYVVDDWNKKSVRSGTEEAIKSLGLQTLYKKEIRLTNNDEDTPLHIALESWWNGVYITILQKPT